MEKVKACFLIASSLLSLFGIKPANNFSFDVYLGPFEKYEKDAEIGFIYNASSDIYKEKVYITTIDGSKTFYFTDTITHSYIKARNTVVFSIILPLSQYLSSAGVKIKVVVFNSSTQKIYISKSKILYPRSHDQIYSTSYQSSSYVSKPVVVNFKNDSDCLEKYSFEKMPLKLGNNSYSQLVFENMQFTYDYYSSYKYQEAYLTTTDPNDLFTDLLDIKANIIKVPLLLTQSSNNIFISLKGDMYVNPESLTMSLSYKSGYQKTNNIYLPLNKDEELKDYPFSIVICNSGDNQIEINIPFTYVQTTYYFDNCVTSDYCVSGGIKE